MAQRIRTKVYLASRFLVLKPHEWLSFWFRSSSGSWSSWEMSPAVSRLTPAGGAALKAVKDALRGKLLRMEFSGGAGLGASWPGPHPMSSLFSTSRLHTLCDESPLAYPTPSWAVHILNFLFRIYLATATRKLMSAPTFYQRLSTVVWRSRPFNLVTTGDCLVWVSLLPPSNSKRGVENAVASSSIQTPV